MMCPNGRVWLLLACRPSGFGSTAWNGRYPLVWIKYLDLETGKLWSGSQNDSRLDAWGEDQVIRAV